MDQVLEARIESRLATLDEYDSAVAVIYDAINNGLIEMPSDIPGWKSRFLPLARRANRARLWLVEKGVKRA